VLSFARPSGACGVSGLAYAKDACESVAALTSLVVIEPSGKGFIIGGQHPCAGQALSAPQICGMIGVAGRYLDRWPLGAGIIGVQPPSPMRASAFSSAFSMIVCGVAKLSKLMSSKTYL
jgi:hypothetical protein